MVNGCYYSYCKLNKYNFKIQLANIIGSIECTIVSLYSDIAINININTPENEKYREICILRLNTNTIINLITIFTHWR